MPFSSEAPAKTPCQREQVPTMAVSCLKKNIIDKFNLLITIKLLKASDVLTNNVIES